MITKEQLRYIVKVYPRDVSQLEAKVEWQKANMDPIDQDYWQKAANQVNKIALEK
jgi:hypothetical protein